MFDLINGLPVHTLVVHAVVVLVPLTALGTIALAVRPRWRHHYGPVVVGLGVLSVIFIPIATSSGEALEKRVGNPGEHAELGDQLIWFVIPLVVLAAALVWMDRRAAIATATGTATGTSVAGSSAAGSSATALKVVAVLAVVAALATSVQVYRVGDSGARAAWGSQVQASSSGSGDSD
ncbi:DUF2231 domain-containing protein [Nocardioides panaciterrulae]|uniref:Putative membrane protein n=1 Tax=Nocardioides panaciterrulae TaxID=661492 RepID=A0A7Y9JBI8_9ACTN|nr:DUF2231 domain-containing protein [Nocardioides panaciterrulae]NYD42246.1 putative membrane protein [Nocardioides panaciterrulae]